MRKATKLLVSITVIIILTACQAHEATVPEQAETTEIPTITITPIETPAVTTKAADVTFLLAVDERKKAIMDSTEEISYTGKAYYVSNSGNDDNDGLSVLTSWATLEKVRTAKLEAGDAVFFERGCFFRGWLECAQGVVYSAYGSGDKPILTESPESGVGSEKWSLFAEGENGEKIWVYHTDMSDCGNIIFNNAESVGFKYAPIWTGSDFINNNMQSFNAVRDLDKNLMFFTPADSNYTTNELPLNLHEERFENAKGKLYLRSDEGNPGEIFEMIEFGAIRKAGTPTVMLESDCIVDNLCLLYAGNCGVMTGGSEHSIVQNCEIGWCGGVALGYDDNGYPTLVGDGFVMDGTDITIADNYIHDNWDNGVTIECGFGGFFTTISDITLIGNLISNNSAGIQITCFSDDMKAEGIIYSNFVIEDNYVTDSGDCWATEQHTYETMPYSICFGDTNLYTDGIHVRDNVFYASTLCHIWGATVKEYLPIFTGNEFYLQNADYSVAVWDIEGIGGNNFLWYWANDWEAFLNDTLGYDNTVILINE